MIVSARLKLAGNFEASCYSHDDTTLYTSTTMLSSLSCMFYLEVSPTEFPRICFPGTIHRIVNGSSTWHLTSELHRTASLV